VKSSGTIQLDEEGASAGMTVANFREKGLCLSNTGSVGLLLALVGCVRTPRLAQ